MLFRFIFFFLLEVFFIFFFILLTSLEKTKTWWYNSPSFLDNIKSFVKMWPPYISAKVNFIKKL